MTDPTARAIRHVIWMWWLCEWKEQLGDVRERRKRRQADKAIAARAKLRGKQGRGCEQQSSER